MKKTLGVIWRHFYSFLILFVIGLSCAQAQFIEIRVLPKIMYVGIGSPFWRDTAAEAFEDYKNYYNLYADTYSFTAINLHPVGPAPQVTLNGIPEKWVADKQYCSNQNGCTVTPDHLHCVQARLVCPEGFTGEKQFPGESDPYDKRSVCRKYDYAKVPCDDCGKGNPILIGGAQKLQIETDYVSANGSLEFKRTYRSNTGTFSSAANTGGLINQAKQGEVFPGCYWGQYENTSPNKMESYYFPYVSSGKAELHLRTPEGKLINFKGPVDAIKPNPDINDKLFQRINQQAQTEWVALRADNSTEIYNTQGLLLRKASVDGKSDTVYSYSDANTPPNIAPRPGLLLSMTDQAGRQLRFTYNANGQLITMIDPADGVYQYTYDALGNLTQRTAPGNQSRTYHYNEPTHTPNGVPRNALTGITDENGNRLADYKYNSAGQAISTERAGAAGKYSFTYPNEVSAKEIDPLGTTRTHTFTSMLSGIRPTGTTQPGPDGQGTVSSKITYDSQANIASQIDFNNLRSCYLYDLSRNLETVRLEGLPGVNACPANVASHILPTPAPGSSVTQRKITTQWHPDWRLQTRRAQPSTLITWVYNGQPDPTAGNAIANCAPAQALLPTDKPIAVLCKQVEQATTDLTGSAGFAASLTPNTPARVWSYTYNEKGQLLTADGPRTDNGILDKTTYTYHPATTSEVTQGDLASISNAQGHTTYYTKYDKHGKLLRSVDHYGITTEHTYHPRGWLLSSIMLPAGISPDSEQAQMQGLVSLFEYDAAGQMIKARTPNGSTITYSYDAAQRLIGMMDNAGNSITYTLDAMGNRLQEQSKDPNAVLARQVNRVIDALNRVQQTVGSAQ